MRPACILTDIEGTTTAIAFVKDALFPFAAAALDEFLAAHGGEAPVAAILREVTALAPGEEPAAALRRWMAEDAKVTPLKALQGLIWRQGYESGAIKGHLWPDVATCLKAWAAGGVGLAVYSSGSEEAQRLLFRHSVAGDLEALFTGFFDTRIGTKRDSASYAAIAKQLGLAAESILFLSDVVEELDAARSAGMATCHLVRAADGTKASGRHIEALDFPAVARHFGLPQPEAPA